MMARKKFLILVTAGLVVAGGIGGVAAQALSMNPEAISSEAVAETTAATPQPSAIPTALPTSATRIDEFFLGDLWMEFLQVGKLTMESCMTDAGFPYDGTTFDGMPEGLSEADQGAWETAAFPCRAQSAAAIEAAEAAYVPSEEERAAALAFAAQYQVWIDAMRSCMADLGHEFVGDVDMTLQTAPFDGSDLPGGMPEGLSPEEQHQWTIDAYAYDSTYPETEQGTWETACVTVADAAYGGPGH